MWVQHRIGGIVEETPAIVPPVDKTMYIWHQEARALLFFAAVCKALAFIPDISPAKLGSRCIAFLANLPSVVVLALITFVVPKFRFVATWSFTHCRRRLMPMSERVKAARESSR